MALLDDFFDSMVDVPRLKHGDRQSINSLINEEAMLLGNYLRNRINIWKPRIELVNSMEGSIFESI